MINARDNYFTLAGILLVFSICHHLQYPHLVNPGLHENPVERNTNTTGHSLFARISVDMTNIPLEKALDIVMHRGNIKLNYNSNRLPLHQKVTLRLTKTPTIQVLLTILNKTATEFKINKNGYFLIIPKKHPNTLFGILTGKIYESSNQKAIPGMQVSLTPSNIITLTDEKGEFHMFKIPAGVYKVAISGNGFNPVVMGKVKVRANEITYLRKEMETYLPRIDEVLNVWGQEKRQFLSASRIFNFVTDEIRDTAGTAGGVSRMLRVNSGVSALSDNNADLIIRGGSPLENGFYIDNIEVPTIDHLPKLGSSGGMYSAINAATIQNIFLFCDGFAADYGDRMSSIVSINLREGNREHFAGQIDYNLAMVGGLFEGPVTTKGSWLASFRKSNLGFLHQLGIELDSYPETFDWQAKLSFDLSSIHKIGILNFFSKGQYSEDSEDIPLRLNSNSQHHTSGINLVSLWNKNLFSNTSIFYTKLHRFDVEQLNETTNKIHQWDLLGMEKYLGIRNVNFLSLTDRAKLEFGFQFKQESNRLEFHRVTRENKLGEKNPEKKYANYETSKWGLFLTSKIDLFKRCAINFGLRSDYSSGQNIFHLSPRLGFNYQMTPQFRVKGSFGVFYQSIPLQYLASIQDPKIVKDMAAHHSSTGIEYENRKGLKVHLDFYYKRYRQLPINPASPNILLLDGIIDKTYNYLFDPSQFILPAVITSLGKGYTSGIELLLRKNIGSFLFLMNASNFKSRYIDLTGKIRDRLYDNRFLLNLTGSYHIKGNFKISARYTYNGGAPFTPVDLKRSMASGQYHLDNSQIMARRYPAYKTINLRVDKTFHFNEDSICLYLDLWNLLDRKNIDYYWYNNYYGGDIQSEDQLSILPVLGISYQF